MNNNLLNKLYNGIKTDIRAMFPNEAEIVGGRKTKPFIVEGLKCLVMPDKTVSVIGEDSIGFNISYKIVPDNGSWELSKPEIKLSSKLYGKDI